MPTKRSFTPLDFRSQCVPLAEQGTNQPPVLGIARHDLEQRLGQPPESNVVAQVVAVEVLHQPGPILGLPEQQGSVKLVDQVVCLSSLAQVRAVGQRSVKSTARAGSSSPVYNEQTHDHVATSIAFSDSPPICTTRRTSSQGCSG